MDNISMKSSKEVVLQFFEILFNKNFFDYDKMETVLGDNFEQHSDGRVRTREQVLKHFEGHKLVKQVSSVEFIVLIESEEQVFAHYVITKPKAKGGETKWNVLAKFIVKDGKLVLSDQVSEVIEDKSEIAN